MVKHKYFFNFDCFSSSSNIFFGLFNCDYTWWINCTTNTMNHQCNKPRIQYTSGRKKHDKLIMWQTSNMTNQHHHKQCNQLITQRTNSSRSNVMNPQYQQCDEPTTLTTWQIDNTINANEQRQKAKQGTTQKINTKRNTKNQCKEQWKTWLRMVNPKGDFIQLTVPPTK